MQTVILRVVMGIALFGLTVSCGGGSAGGPAGSQPFTVDSPDGSVNLEFPEGALPDGIDPSDVQVRLIPTDDVLTVVEGPPAIRAFELQPDGLELREPAIVTVSGTWDEFRSGAWVVRVHGGEVDLIGTTQLTIHPNDVATLRYAISHFSKDCVTHMSGVELRLHAPPRGSSLSKSARVFHC